MMTIFVVAHVPLLVYSAVEQAVRALEKSEAAQKARLRGYLPSGEQLSVKLKSGAVVVQPSSDPPDPSGLETALRRYLLNNKISVEPQTDLASLVERVEKFEAAFTAEHDPWRICM